MNEKQKKALLENLDQRKEKVHRFLMSKAEAYRRDLSVRHLSDATTRYIKDGGKSLRAGILLFSCGAVGGDEEIALPAAAALEVFHAWTLVQDDIIDQDDRRRGRPTIHEEYKHKAMDEWGLGEEDAKHYGESMGILAGDVLQGWVVSLFSELYQEQRVSPDVVVHLLHALYLPILGVLSDGQALDIQLPRFPLESIREETILDMYWKKTGSLYEFAGKAGAMIGLNNKDPDHAFTRALASFAGRCGVAFQLRDDVLGVIGDEKLLGKPTGSDIKEGKRTIVNVYALNQADEKQRETLLGIFGNKHAAPEEIEAVKGLLRELGGVDYCLNLAETCIQEARNHMDVLPASIYKDLLGLWAESILKRNA